MPVRFRKLAIEKNSARRFGCRRSENFHSSANQFAQGIFAFPDFFCLKFRRGNFWFDCSIRINRLNHRQSARRRSKSLGCPIFPARFSFASSFRKFSESEPPRFKSSSDATPSCKAFHAIRRRSLPAATLLRKRVRSRRRREFPSHFAKKFRSPAACKRLGCGVLPSGALSRKRIRPRVQNFRSERPKVPADRAQGIGFRRARFFAKKFRGRECPSPRSNNLRWTGGRADDRELRGRRRYFRGRRVGREKLRPRRFYRFHALQRCGNFFCRRVDAAARAIASRSSASGLETLANRAALEPEFSRTVLLFK